MANVTAQVMIYTKSWCPYCKKAKALLTEKGASFTEFDVENQPDKLAEMIAKTDGRKTVPQIFINDLHIGGCDDLYALDALRKLDGLLA